MTGMTPPVFTFSGMCVLAPPYIRRPDHAPRVLHRDAPVPALDEHDARRRRATISTISRTQPQQAHLARLQLLRASHARRAAGPTTMPA